MNNAAPINLELVADSIFPSLMMVSSPEAIKKQTMNNPKNDPIPFKVLIRLDLFPTMFFIPKYNTDETMMKRTTYALYNIISIPESTSDNINRTKTIPRTDKPIAETFNILYKSIVNFYFLLFTKISISDIEAFSISLTILSIFAIM